MGRVFYPVSVKPLKGNADGKMQFLKLHNGRLASCITPLIKLSMCHILASWGVKELLPALCCNKAKLSKYLSVHVQWFCHCILFAYVYVYINIYKWTHRHELKSWMRLFAFHIVLIPLAKDMNPILLSPPVGK